MLDRVQLQVKEREIDSGGNTQQSTILVESLSCEERPWDGDRHLPSVRDTKRHVVDDILSDRQVTCWIFRWFQPRAYKETGDEKQDADEGGAYPHAIGKAYTPVKQVVQHDRMDDRSE